MAVVAMLATGLPAGAEDGALWAPSLPSRHEGFNYLSLFDDGTGHSYRSNGTDNGPLFVTSDFGVTWTTRTVPPFGMETGHIDFGSPEVGYGVASNDLYRTTDGGRSWEPVELPASGVGANTHPLSTRTQVFEVVDADTLVLGRTMVPPPPGGEDCTPMRLLRPELAITRDGGQTWSTQQFGDTMLDVRAIAIHGDDVAVLTSPVDGDPDHCSYGAGGPAPDTVWVRDQQTGEYRPVFTCIPDQECRDLAWAGDVLVAVANYGWVHRSEDQGETWTTSRVLGVVSSTVPDYPLAGGVPDGIEFADETVGYASFNANGIWRTTDAGASWVMETSPHEVLGIASGSIAVAGRDHALAGGPNAIYRRVPPVFGSPSTLTR